MINIDWNGYDNASTHTTQFYVLSTNSDCDMGNDDLYTQQIYPIKKVDKHESLFAKLISVCLIKKRTNSKWVFVGGAIRLNPTARMSALKVFPLMIATYEISSRHDTIKNDSKPNLTPRRQIIFGNKCDVK